MVNGIIDRGAVSIVLGFEQIAVRYPGQSLGAIVVVEDQRRTVGGVARQPSIRCSRKAQRRCERQNR
jgi:hypothetical protein